MLKKYKSRIFPDTIKELDNNTTKARVSIPVVLHYRYECNNYSKHYLIEDEFVFLHNNSLVYNIGEKSLDLNYKNQIVDIMKKKFTFIEYGSVGNCIDYKNNSHFKKNYIIPKVINIYLNSDVYNNINRNIARKIKLDTILSKF